MKQIGRYVGAAVLAAAAFSGVMLAQGRGGGAPQPMSFFVTSVPKGDGANYGGLAGADAHCQMLAAAAGRGDATWRGLRQGDPKPSRA